MSAAARAASGLARRLPLRRPLDLGLTLGPLWRGHHDRTMRVARGEVWRATRTPAGPATLRLRTGSGRLDAAAWGAGAAWALEQVPELLGEDDDPGELGHAGGLVGELYRRHPGLRIPHTRAVFEALVPVVLEQKVTGREARDGYGRLLNALADPAPGPGSLLLPLAPEAVTTAPSWLFHRCGVERRRASILGGAARVASRLEETTAMPPAEARARLRAVPGIGPWSSAEIATVALGDADAVPVGDYHIPSAVSWALAGEARGDDARMLELLEPYRGQRARVVRLILAAGIRAPRFGPKLAVRDIRRI